jgi:ATP-binding cassette subfamily B protein
VFFIVRFHRGGDPSENPLDKSSRPLAENMNLSFKSYWNLLSDHIRPQKRTVHLLAVMLFSSIGLRIFAPQIMRRFIDSALAGEALSTLTWTAVAFIGIALLQQGVHILVTYLGENVAWTATNALRAELAEHALQTRHEVSQRPHPGELIERIDGDVTELATFFSQFALNLIANGLLLIGILVTLSLEDWRVGLAFAVYSAITIGVLGRLKDIAVPHQKARREAEGQMYGFIEEQLAGTEDIRSSGAVDFPSASYSAIKPRSSSTTAARTSNAGSSKTRWAFAHHGTLLAITSGYWLFTAGVVTIGTVYLFVHYLNLLEEPFWAMTHEIESFQTIGACVERLTEFKQFQPETKNETGKVIDSYPLALEFKDVTFSYNGEDSVIKRLSLDLKPGSVLGCSVAPEAERPPSDG